MMHLCSTCSLPVFLVVLGLAGCGSHGDQAPVPPRAAAAPEANPCPDSYPSAPALAEAFLRGLKEKDRKALEAIRVTEKEYREVYFPEFPAHYPVNLQRADFYWSLLEAESRTGLDRALGDHGGDELEFLDLTPTNGVERYTSYRILSKVELRVRRKATGEEGRMRTLGTIVERDGRFKVLAYRD